jgi:hypothetical protein
MSTYSLIVRIWENVSVQGGDDPEKWMDFKIA